MELNGGGGIKRKRERNIQQTEQESERGTMKLNRAGE